MTAAQSDGASEPQDLARPPGPPIEEAVMAVQARQRAERVIEKLGHWLENPDARISLAAASTLLERAYGKPGVRAEPEPAYDPIVGIRRVVVDPKPR